MVGIFPVRYVNVYTRPGIPPFSYGFPMVFLWFSHSKLHLTSSFKLQPGSSRRIISSWRKAPTRPRRRWIEAPRSWWFWPRMLSRWRSYCTCHWVGKRRWDGNGGGGDFYASIRWMDHDICIIIHMYICIYIYICIYMYHRYECE